VPELSNPFDAPEHQPFVLGKSDHKVLLIHGFPGTPLEVRPLAEHLVTQGFEAHAPLLPGFGSDIATLKDRTRADWIRATGEAWDELSCQSERCVLMGFSMGAAICMHVASERHQSADAVKEAVYIAPFSRFDSPFAGALAVLRYLKPWLKPFAKADFADESVREQFATMYPEADLDDPEMQQTLRQEIVLPTSSLDELRRLGTSAKKQAQRQPPCLVLQGNADAVVTPSSTAKLVQNMPKATLVEIADATHEVIKAGAIGHDLLLEHVRDYLAKR
jgi:carboxylesterase